MEDEWCSTMTHGWGLPGSHLLKVKLKRARFSMVAPSGPCQANVYVPASTANWPYTRTGAGVNSNSLSLGRRAKKSWI